jgi:hypothetical protein
MLPMLSQQPRYEKRWALNKYHVRFNTKHNGSDLVWRIFENGAEHLASDVRIIGETFTECTHEHGEKKWNIACKGRLIWVDNVAVIVTDKD